MSGSIIVEHIRYGSSRSKQAYLRRIIILEQSLVKESGEKTRQIRVELEHHGEIRAMTKDKSKA